MEAPFLGSALLWSLIGVCAIFAISVTTWSTLAFSFLPQYYGTSQNGWQPSQRFESAAMIILCAWIVSITSGLQVNCGLFAGTQCISELAYKFPIHLYVTANAVVNYGSARIQACLQGRDHRRTLAIKSHFTGRSHRR